MLGLIQPVFCQWFDNTSKFALVCYQVRQFLWPCSLCYVSKKRFYIYLHVGVMCGATNFYKTASIWSSACNVHGNVSLYFMQNFSMGDPGVLLLKSPWLHSKSSSSRVVVGNGGLNSKTILCTIWLVLPWNVTYMLWCLHLNASLVFFWWCYDRISILHQSIPPIYTLTCIGVVPTY